MEAKVDPVAEKVLDGKSPKAEAGVAVPVPSADKIGTVGVKSPVNKIMEPKAAGVKHPESASGPSLVKPGTLPQVKAAEAKAVLVAERPNADEAKVVPVAKVEVTPKRPGEGQTGKPGVIESCSLDWSPACEAGCRKGWSGQGGGAWDEGGGLFQASGRQAGCGGKGAEWSPCGSPTWEAGCREAPRIGGAGEDACEADRTAEARGRRSGGEAESEAAQGHQSGGAAVDSGSYCQKVHRPADGRDRQRAGSGDGQCQRPGDHPDSGNAEQDESESRVCRPEGDPGCHRLQLQGFRENLRADLSYRDRR